jgi:hypothetical protein
VSLSLRIVFVERLEYADAPHPLCLLRSCRKRPCHRAAKSSDEIAPSKAHLSLTGSGSAIDEE